VVAACTAAVTIATVREFTRAWSRGDVAAAMQLVAPEPHFRWVSSGRPGPRYSPAASNRASLAAYLRGRARRHDSVVVRTIRFNGSDVRDGASYGHFALTARRTSDDWPAGLPHVREAKGAVVCSLDHPVVAVFSIG
jgi:hypothetical protein